jgi:hypothetical protein
MDDYIINFDLVYVDTETRMTFKIVPEFFQVLTNWPRDRLQTKDLLWQLEHIVISASLK